MQYENVTKTVDVYKVLDLTFFDYSNAFDRVNHLVLLEKMHSIGVSGYVLEWTSAFLTQRLMKVRVSNVLSAPWHVTSGVPQGSVLGPLLFLLYINHVVSGLTCRFKVFADDVKLYLAHKNILVDVHKSSRNYTPADY